MEERRRYPRYECYLIVEKKRSQQDEVDFFGVVQNMSAGGAMIKSDYRPAQGQIVSLAFFQEGRRQLWEGKGKVVWVESEDHTFFFGLEFLEPLEENWHEALAMEERP